MRFRVLLTLATLFSISFGKVFAAPELDLDSRESCKNYIDEVFAETVEILSRKELPPASNYDLLSQAVEKYYNGTNKIILDDLGFPSIMVEFDSFKDSPMYKVKGKIYPRVFIGKYEASVFHGRAYSLPNVDPATNIDSDRARELSRNKGIGWHVTSNVEYSAIARFCRENHFYPQGNTSRVFRMATGSGAASWSHDESENGIYDLIGNVWEFADGIRLIDGELQVIRDNDVAVPECWNDWKAVEKSGKLVEIGATNKTWKIDSTRRDLLDTFHQIENAKSILSLKRKRLMYREDTDLNFGFSECSLKDLVSNRKKYPEILELHSLVPPKDLDKSSEDLIWVRNYGHRKYMRGGMWFRSSGMFGGSFAGAWNDVSDGIGFRISYIELENPSE